MDLLAISLPLIEKASDIEYLDPQTGNLIRTQLNYTSCNWPKDSYNITKIYKHSWTSEFDIECDKFKIGLIGSFTFAGIFTGSLFFKFACDSFGRKKTALFGGMGYTTTLLIFLFSHHFYLNIVLSFIGCFFSVNLALTSYLLVTESVSHHLRGSFGAVIMTGFSACGIIYALFFKFLESWRIVFIISSSSTYFFIIIFYLLLQESPIFYVYKGDYKNFIETCKNIAKVNNRFEVFSKTISEDTEFKRDLIEIEMQLNKKSKQGDFKENLSDPENGKEDTCKSNVSLLINENIKNDDMKNLISKGNDKKNKYGILALLTYSQIRYKFLILCFLWFTTSGNYYGLTINLKNLPGDIYLVNIINYTFEAVSYFFAGYIINVKWAGRKRTVLFLHIMAVIIFTCISLIHFNEFFSMLFPFLAKFAFAALFNILYTYSLEIYPTCVRAQGFGINSAMARVLSIKFPIVIELFGEIITMIFLVLNILCSVLVCFLPETLGKPLRNGMEEDDSNR